MKSTVYKKPFRTTFEKFFDKIKKIFSFGKNTSLKFDTTTEVEKENKPWWGTFQVEEEQSRFFKIGEVILCLDRYNREWHISSYKNGDLPIEVSKNNPKESFNMNLNTKKQILPVKKPYKAFAAQAKNEITLKPTLPDRELLAQLNKPIYIPVGEPLLLYISSPLWIRIEAGSPAILLEEIPTEILSDTWFGKSTLDGELCYSHMEHCSPRLEDLPHDSNHVVTPMMIMNRSRETMLLRELKIPLPELSVYSDAQNLLWTEQINIYFEHYHSSETKVKGPLKSLKNLQLLQPARFGSRSGLSFFNPFK